jgi:colicin import membrane protein
MDNNRSLFISLLFHILLLAFLLNFKNTDVLIPSRSDGMEVELISQPPQVVQREAPAKPTEYTVQNTNTADVKLKQPDTTPVPPVKPKAQTPPKPTPTPKPIKKPTQDAQINDLLNDIVPSKGNSKGKATGGSNLGTSDTNNMAANYADLVIARVRPYVQIPDDTDSNIKVVVEVTLLPNMQVYKVRLVTPSGNDLYDSNVQQAINRVQTFPPLPDGANFSDFRKIKLTFKPQ